MVGLVGLLTARVDTLGWMPRIGGLLTLGGFGLWAYAAAENFLAGFTAMLLYGGGWVWLSYGLWRPTAAGSAGTGSGAGNTAINRVLTAGWLAIWLFLRRSASH